jgi:hypothetical protein
VARLGGDEMVAVFVGTGAAAAADEAAAAVVFAEQSPAPTVESIMDDVYWEVDNKTAAGATWVLISMVNWFFWPKRRGASRWFKRTTPK